ncbi:MAG: hypothetical protein ACOCVM_01600 [Desulfovibrionaceae bacterium]
MFSIVEEADSLNITLASRGELAELAVDECGACLTRLDDLFEIVQRPAAVDERRQNLGKM